MGRRVALLARPGVACDRLRVALADAGAQLVLEADPLTLDPATLDAAQAQVVMVALDAQTEEALERFETALQDPAIEVIFEEAELAAKREGWEAARWVRHLAAKLHRHGDVLPPGAESATGVASKAGSDNPLPFEEPVSDLGFATGTTIETESVAAPDFGLDIEAAPQSESFEAAPDFGLDIEAAPPAQSSVASSHHAFDPLLAEMSFDEVVGADAGDDSHTPGALPSFDTDLDFSYDGSFEPVAAVPTDVEHASGFDPYDFNQAHVGAEPAVAAPERNFDQVFDGDFAAAAGVGLGAEPETAKSAAAELDTSAASPLSSGIKHVLELVPDDDVAPALRGYAEPSAETSQADGRFRHDLASLESRIAGMELIDDRVTKGPAQASGAVLVMAGIGGPDAVRQLLGALPPDFQRPVLVQQRLDGGRYDKLVAQMQRATTLPVKLAEPGLPVLGGEIYILPADISIKLTDAGIEFVGGGADVLAALPSADSAVLMLSGSDPALVDAVMNHSWAGALVIGQAPDGCYDAAAPSALVARGGASGQPADLARRLADRWRT
ncbi:MAG: chemotaxis protein CheB [Lysobacter sp.]